MKLKLRLILSWWIVILALASVALATPPSLTTVTVTLTDSTGQVWANAQWQANFTQPFGNPASPLNNGNPITSNHFGTADGTGTFTVILDDNTVVTPAGSTWQFIMCPNASVQSCTVANVSVHGATQNLSASLSSFLITPIVNTAPTIARAYKDSEAIGGFGALYINSIDGTMRQCLIAICNGTGWQIVIIGTVNPVFTGTLTVPCVKFNFDLADDTTVCSQGATGHIAVTLPAIAGTLALLNSPAFTGSPTAPTQVLSDNSTLLATDAFVKNQNYITSSGAPVQSVFGRTGTVVATSGDYTVGQVTGAAPTASPTFTGTPVAPTNGTATDNTTQLATDQFVQSAIAATTPISIKVRSLTTNTGQAIANSAQTWITKAITMPSSGCPCAVLVSFSMLFTASNSGTAVCWVDDNNGSGNVFATGSALTNTAGTHSMSCNGASVSPVTYSNSATVTFVGRGQTDASGGLTVGSGQFGSMQASYLSIAVLTSN